MVEAARNVNEKLLPFFEVFEVFVFTNHATMLRIARSTCASTSSSSHGASDTK